MAYCFIYVIHLLYAADVVPVKPLRIYEAIFTLVTAGNMSVYQHGLERKRVRVLAWHSTTASQTHTERKRERERARALSHMQVSVLCFLEIVNCGCVLKDTSS